MASSTRAITPSYKFVSAVLGRKFDTTKSVVKKNFKVERTTGSHQYLSMCRSETNLPSTLSLKWSQGVSSCTTSATFYLCDKASGIKRQNVLEFCSSSMNVTVSAGEDLIWTAPTSSFHSLAPGESVPDKGKSTYIYADTVVIDTSTTPSCKKKTDTNSWSRIATVKDYHCSALVKFNPNTGGGGGGGGTGSGTSSGSSSGTSSGTGSSGNMDDGATCGSFCLNFFYLLLVACFVCVSTEIGKFAMYQNEKREYHTKFAGSNDAKIVTVEVTNVLVSVGETKTTDTAIMKAPCPKCEKEITRPLNTPKWQCVECGCMVMLSDSGLDFVNADDLASASERSSFDTFQIGERERER